MERSREPREQRMVLSLGPRERQMVLSQAQREHRLRQTERFRLLRKACGRERTELLRPARMAHSQGQTGRGRKQERAEMPPAIRAYPEPGRIRTMYPPVRTEKIRRQEQPGTKRMMPGPAAKGPERSFIPMQARRPGMRQWF